MIHLIVTVDNIERNKFMYVLKHTCDFACCVVILKSDVVKRSWHDGALPLGPVMVQEYWRSRTIDNGGYHVPKSTQNIQIFNGMELINLST